MFPVKRGKAMIKNVGVGCYNSYLLIGEKTALIDSVPEEFSGELIENIKNKLNDKRLDYIIFNHTEADRAGAFLALQREFPDACVYASISGIKNLCEILNADFKSEVIKSNATLKLSDDITLRFLITHNINWPDSVMVYYEEEKTLFSCDAFSNEGEGEKEYYIKKLSYLSDYVNSAMQLLKTLDILKICPGSGNAHNGTDIIDSYIVWSKREKREKPRIAVVFESQSGNNKKYSKKAFEILENCGADAVLCDAGNEERETVLKAIYESDGVIFATPTIYRNIPDKLLSVILSLNHYEMADKYFCCFGSYGWSGEAPNLVYSYLRTRHFNTYKAPFRFMFLQTADEENEFGKYILDFYYHTLKQTESR